MLPYIRAFLHDLLVMGLVNELLNVVLPEVPVARHVRLDDHLHGLGLAHGDQPRGDRGPEAGVRGAEGRRHLPGDH